MSRQDVEDLGEEEVGDENQDRGEHHRVRRGPAHPVGATLRRQAIVAPDDGDKICEEKITDRSFAISLIRLRTS